jgi:hypothetical protein
MHDLNWGKSGPKVLATILIFKNLPKINNHPMSETSAYLVTLSEAFLF